MEIKSVTLDLETTGLDTRTDDIILLAYRYNSVGPVKVVKWYKGERPDEEFIQAITNPSVVKRGHNIGNFDALFLDRYLMADVGDMERNDNGGTGRRGIVGPFDDTRIIYYLENPFNDVGLKNLVENKLKRKVTRLEDLVIPLKKKDSIPDNTVEIRLKSSKKRIDVDKLITYNQADVVNCDDLRKEAVVTDWYRKVEQPLIDIIHNMEFRGIQLDTKYLKDLKNEFEETAYVERQKIHTTFGEINPNSPKQVKEGLKKMGTTCENTDSLTLKRQLWAGKSDLKPILEYRKYNKLLTTYINPLLEKSDENGRIHGSFNQAGTEENSGGTKTGRLTSSEPNLQNIPTRTEVGKKVRKAFIATPGFILIDSDLKQIEPRLIAHYSQSPKLIKAFSEGLDTHGLMACDIFKKDKVEDLTKMERFVGKTSWLATVYGCWYKKLKDIVERNSDEYVPYEERFYEEVQNNFWEANPEIKNWRQEHIESTRRCGFITTIGGRFVKIQGLNSSNKFERREAERMAVNYLVQGSAADIMKMALIKVAEYARLREGHLLATVHDEILLELPDLNKTGVRTFEELAQTTLISDAMTSIVSLKNVGLEADTKIIANWGEK